MMEEIGNEAEIGNEDETACTEEMLDGTYHDQAEQAGHSIEELTEFVGRILNHSRGWVRAGYGSPGCLWTGPRGSSATSLRDRPDATKERPAR